MPHQPFSFRRLRTKLIAAFLVVMLIPVAQIGLYGYSFTSRVLSQGAVESAMREVQLQAQHIVRSLAQAQGDALYLAELRSLTAMRQAQAEGSMSDQVRLWRGEAAQDFMVLLSVRPMYRSLRYLDQQGMEIVRVESDGQQVWNTPLTEYANRQHTHYFQNAMAQPPGSVFVSPFSLDDEMRTDMPVVHYAMRIAEGDGVVLIDIHAGWILRNLPDNVRQETWALIDQDGYYLVYPETYTPPVISAEGHAQVAPSLEKLLSGGMGALETDENVFIYDTIYPSASSDNLYWVLYRDSPRAVLYATGNDFFQKAALFLALALVVAIGMAVFISHSIVAPILDLQRKAASFGQGGAAPSMPSRLPPDEIGALAQTFYEMAQELERKRREARLLIERLITAQEEERKLVAYDLHDGLIQHLVGARLYLTNFRQHCPLDNPAAQTGLTKGCDALSEAIVEGRRIIEGLRPAALDDLGLMAALAELAQTTAQDAGWQLELDLHALPVEPEKTIGVTLYRIAQEALNNARKYADAHFVRLHLSNGQGITLSIYDDGKGFDTQAAAEDERGLGITTMRERAELLNGKCILTSALGEGTSITIWIPWQPGETRILMDELIEEKTYG